MNVKALFLVFCLFISSIALADQVDPRSTTGQSLNFPTDQISTVIVDSRYDNLYTYPVTIACNQADDSPRNGRKVILAVHGFVHDRDAWTYVGDYVLEHFGEDVYKFCAIDLPGHGESGWDPTISYGKISLLDYVQALDKVIDFLNEDNDLTYGDLTLYGHSLGGTIIQILQNQLISTGSNLADKNVSNVVLWDSVPPKEVKWLESKSPAFLLKFLSLVNVYSGGLYGSTTNNDYWVKLFFTDRDTRQVIQNGLPDQDAVAYLNNTEPGQAALEMIGFDSDLKRPEISSGIFASEFGTELYSVNFGQGQYISLTNTQDLHSHLVARDIICETDLESTPCISVPSLPHDGIVSIVLSTDDINSQYLDSIVRMSL